MTLSKLGVTAFRNIQHIDIQPHAKFNLVWGDNGAGKTSLLESIYYLSCAKSFKTNLTQSVIQNDHDQLTIHGIAHYHNTDYSLGIAKKTDGTRKIHINSEKTRSIAELSCHLPTLLITTTSYRFFHDGPKFRRQLVDWGLFHMEPEYNATWKAYQTVLKQRNASIKSQRYSQIIQTWDTLLAEHGDKINIYRESYIKQIKPFFMELVGTLLPELPQLDINYNKGWSQEQSLLTAIEQAYQQDNRLGYTTKGPHRADLVISCNQVPVCEYLSQGQQKLAVTALKLAQGKLLAIEQNQSPIYLIDDLPSELDDNKIQLICNALIELSSQTFITTIRSHSISQFIQENQFSLFHMKQGRLNQ